MRVCCDGQNCTAYSNALASRAGFCVKSVTILIIRLDAFLFGAMLRLSLLKESITGSLANEFIRWCHKRLEGRCLVIGYF